MSLSLLGMELSYSKVAGHAEQHLGFKILLGG